MVTWSTGCKRCQKRRQKGAKDDSPCPGNERCEAELSRTAVYESCDIPFPAENGVAIISGGLQVGCTNLWDRYVTTSGSGQLVNGKQRLLNSIIDVQVETYNNDELSRRCSRNSDSKLEKSM